MKEKTYIYSAKYIIKPPYMIWRTTKSLQNSQPFGTKNSAASCQLRREIGYVINPRKRKKNIVESNKSETHKCDILNELLSHYYQTSHSFLRFKDLINTHLLNNLVEPESKDKSNRLQMLFNIWCCWATNDNQYRCQLTYFWSANQSDFKISIFMGNMKLKIM